MVSCGFSCNIKQEFIAFEKKKPPHSSSYKRKVGFN